MSKGKSKGKGTRQNYGKHGGNLTTRFQIFYHILVHKKFPLLGWILDQLATVPLFLRISFALVAALWKFYIIYILLRYLSSYNRPVSSSPTLSGGGVGGTTTPAASHPNSAYSILTSLSKKSDIIPQKDIVQVEEQAGKNYMPVNHLSTPQDLNQNQEQDHNGSNLEDAESFSHLHQQGQRDAPKVLTSTIDNYSRDNPPLRVLHIVTSLDEYDDGRRDTVKGGDRFQENMIPTLVESVATMIAPPYNYHVDVYLILAWKIKPERRRLVEDALPEGVGLDIWDDAMPIGYNMPHHTMVMEIDRSLARQHRFVMKDKLEYYDVFSAFEDDMLITGGHISYYLEVSAELDQLKDDAPDELPTEPKLMPEEHFHGPMSKTQVQRLIPGFIRAEVLLEKSKWPIVSDLGPIPVDLEFDLKDNDGATTTRYRTFDPIPCCKISDVDQLLGNPQHDQVVLWEAAIIAAKVRQLPKGNASSKPDILDWVLLQSGSKVAHNEKYIGGYWSGRDGALGPDVEKPREKDPKYFANQGGWMVTREQLIFMHSTTCFAGILPPYDLPAYKQDGLLRLNVEYWSGGLQIYGHGEAGCNMQRVISLHPDHFSKHFLYHTSNNKQKGGLLSDKVIKVKDFYGQLNSVVKAARKKNDQAL